MIRSEVERRNAGKDLAYLRTELEQRADSQQADTREVAGALRIKASDVEAKIREYDGLKSSHVPTLEAESLDGLGELLVKGRISRGWSQADLAKVLEMEPQQVQRYERNDWQPVPLVIVGKMATWHTRGGPQVYILLWASVSPKVVRRKLSPAMLSTIAIA
jgi:hypothetical protein